MPEVPWRNDAPPIANRRQRINEKLDEFTNLVRWYNSGIISLTSMLRLLKSINFVPGPEAIRVLESPPVSLHELIRSLEKTYRPEIQSVEHPSTNFVEAMMSPIIPSRWASHRKDAQSQIRLMFSEKSEPEFRKSVSYHTYDHGDIIGWNDDPPTIKRKQIRQYTNRSSIVSNGSVQPKVIEKISTKRHFVETTREYVFQQETLKPQQSQQPQSPSSHRMSPEVPLDSRCKYKIALDPNYKGARAPFGTDTDEAEALAKISPFYSLQAPFDTDLPDEGHQLPAHVKIPWY